MQIDFKALEQALAPIKEIGQGELTFDAGTTPVTLRILLPVEELEVQRFAGVVFENASEDTTETEQANNAISYLDKFRTATLSYSMIQVGGLDLRDADFVATGEKLDNGADIKVPRHKALKQLIEAWPRAVLVRAFHKYSELLNQVEAKAEKAIVFQPSNYEAEIERLEGRVADLKEAQEKEKADSEEAFSARVKAVASQTEGTQPEPAQTPEPDEPVLDPQQAMSPVHRRTGPISPGAAPPPMVSGIEQPTAPPARRKNPPKPDSSFINDEDDDAMNAALDAEHARIMARRRAAATGQAPMSEGSALETIHPQTRNRRPPHQAAAQVEDEVGAVRPVAEQMGELDGKPVFKMPTQELSTPASRGAGRAVVNQAVDQQKNPRFRPPNKP